MNDRRTNPTPDEDFRVALARQTLAESQQAEPVDCARWWGTLEHTVETLLHVIDETPSGGAA